MMSWEKDGGKVAMLLHDRSRYSSLLNTSKLAGRTDNWLKVTANLIS